MPETQSLSPKYEFSFTIRRSIWARGKINRPSHPDAELQLINHLYNQKIETLCCLGIFGLACNIPIEAMVGVAEPDDLFKEHKIEPSQVSKEYLKLISITQENDEYEFGTYTIFENTALASECMSLNDDESLTEEERESKIRAEFAKKNIEVIFVD